NGRRKLVGQNYVVRLYLSAPSFDHWEVHVMSNSQAQWQSVISMILPDAADSAVLVVSDETGWSLPKFKYQGRAEVNTIRPIVDFMRGQLGVEAGVLRCLNVQLNGDACRAALIFLLESRDPSRQPTQGRWIEPESLAMLKFADKEHPQAIEAYFEKRSNG